MAMYLALLLLGPVSAASTSAHPAVKVITLLAELQEKVKEEQQAEAAGYGKFTFWCSETERKKTKAIADAEAVISRAEAQIEGLAADISSLEASVAAINEELTQDEAYKKNAEDTREGENGEFVNTQSDLQATIQAVDDAIKSLEEHAPALLSKEAHAAVQKALAFVDIYAPAVEARKVHSFLQREEPTGPGTQGTGRVREYDFKSGGVIDILKQLKLKFEDELEELSMAETNAVNAHKLSDLALEQQIDAGNKAKTTKTDLIAAKSADKGAAETELKEAMDDRADAKAVLDDTKSTCASRADEFAERKTRREGEAAAMQQAIEVLEKITGTRAPAGAEVSFLQIADPRMQVVNLIRKAQQKGKAFNAAALGKLADAIAKTEAQPLGSGTFDQIVNMIQKMIFRLKAEQTDEDNHKLWCDTEISKTEKMLEDKNTTHDRLTTEINQLEAEIEKNAETIRQNNDQVAEMQADLENLHAMRAESKTENAATVKDAEDAQAAIAQAVAVLTDFYKSTGAVEKKDWELVQLRQVRRARAASPEGDEASPELGWEPGTGSAYKAVDGGVDVIGMMEDIAADFAGMESDAKASEVKEQEEYDEDVTANEADVAGLQKDSEMKTAKNRRLGEKLEAARVDFKNTVKELEATQQYMKDLGHPCLAGDSSYTDRKAARTSEIDALKQAQGVLQNAFNEAPAEGSAELEEK